MTTIARRAEEIVAPEYRDADPAAPSVFLAGGISSCPDWQARVVAMLAGRDVVLFNPRRPAYGESEEAARAQIAWEFAHLRRASAVLFWFPGGPSPCPIALFELGACAQWPDKPLFVGCGPAYSRRIDVEVQLSLVRPEVRVESTLEGLAAQVASWLHERG